MRAARSRSLTLLAPQFDPLDAFASYPLPAADGRGWKYSSPLKFWPMRRDPPRPSAAVTRLPAADVGNATQPTAHTTSGYAIEQIANVAAIRIRWTRIWRIMFWSQVIGHRVTETQRTHRENQECFSHSYVFLCASSVSL